MKNTKSTTKTPFANPYVNLPKLLFKLGSDMFSCAFNANKTVISNWLAEHDIPFDADKFDEWSTGSMSNGNHDESRIEWQVHGMNIRFIVQFK